MYEIERESLDTLTGVLRPANDICSAWANSWPNAPKTVTNTINLIVFEIIKINLCRQLLALNLKFIKEPGTARRLLTLYGKSIRNQADFRTLGEKQNEKYSDH